MHRPAFAALLVSSCATLSACGGGDTPRPTVPLTEADRTPSADCTTGTGSRFQWVAGFTVRAVDPSGRGLPNALVQPCLVFGADDTGICLEGARTDASGWSAQVLPAENRCVSRIALRVEVDGDAASYKIANLTGASRGVLNVPGSVTVVPVDPAMSRDPFTTPTADHEVTFADGSVLTIRPSALGSNPAAQYAALGMSTLRTGIPDFVRQGSSVDLALAFAPDVELDAPARIVVPAPSTLPNGTQLDAYVLGGIYTTISGGEHVPEGELGRFATVTVTDGMIPLDVPRLGWIALRRR